MNKQKLPFLISQRVVAFRDQTWLCSDSPSKGLCTVLLASEQTGRHLGIESQPTVWFPLAARRKYPVPAVYLAHCGTLALLCQLAHWGKGWSQASVQFMPHVTPPAYQYECRDGWRECSRLMEAPLLPALLLKIPLLLGMAVQAGPQSDLQLAMCVAEAVEVVLFSFWWKCI